MTLIDGDASADTREAAEESAAESNEHDRMLAVLDGAIDEAHRKVESGRVYDADNEKVRIKWIRALAYALNVRRQIVQDRDLEELSERIEELEQLQEEQR